MLTRVSPVWRLASNVGRQQSRKMSAPAADLRQQAVAHRVTMNDLPVPQGSWSEANAKKQSKYNMYLIASVLFFGASYFLNEVTQATYGHGMPSEELIAEAREKAKVPVDSY